METRHSRPMVALLGLIAALAAVASAAGVFFRGDLATQPFTTVRGDVIDSLVAGVYRFNGKTIAAEGVGWDAVTLLLVVPALLLALPWLWRGSLRASLFVTGILAYFLYQYFEYATFLAYGPFFALYVAIVALSVSGIGLLVGGIGVEGFPARFSAKFPRRAAIGFGLYMAILLSGLWLPLIARTSGAAQVPDLAGGTTLVVQAFDLGLLVPLGLFTAATVYRRLPIGYLLAAVVVVKGMAMGAGITAMLLFEGYATGALQIVPIVIFTATSLISAAIAVRVYTSIEASALVPPRPSGSPAMRPSSAH